MMAVKAGTGEPDRPRPGRRGLDDIVVDVARALRVVDDPDALSQQRLARDPLVASLAERRYGRVTRLTRGCALRDLLKLCLGRIAEGTPEPFSSFTKAYAEQTPISVIARDLRMTRSHLSRVYRRRLATMVADELQEETHRETLIHDERAKVG